MLWSQNIYVSILFKIYGANAVAVRRQNQSYDKNAYVYISYGARRLKGTT